MNNENQILRLSIAIFAAIVLHTIIAVSIHLLDITLIEIKDKTVPFVLVSANTNAQVSSTATLSAEENSRAAQEYLATLNQSQFETNSNTYKNEARQGKQVSPGKNTPSQAQPTSNSLGYSGSNSSTAINRLQGIFSQNKQLPKPEAVKQISTEELAQLSDYEVLLLNSLARDALYDPFHEVMKSNKKTEVSYTISLSLFPNGAIKNASILKPSGLNTIDKLAIQAAYRASPFPKPPAEDIQKGYKYQIPILYQSKNRKK